MSQVLHFVSEVFVNIVHSLSYTDSAYYITGDGNGEGNGEGEGKVWTTKGKVSTEDNVLTTKGKVSTGDNVLTTKRKDSGPDVGSVVAICAAMLMSVMLIMLGIFIATKSKPMNKRVPILQYYNNIIMYKIINYFDNKIAL